MALVPRIVQEDEGDVLSAEPDRNRVITAPTRFGGLARRSDEAPPVAGDDAAALDDEPARRPLDHRLDVRLAVDDDEIGGAAGREPVPPSPMTCAPP